MSAPVVVSSIEFSNNPAAWTDPFKLQITFEAYEYLEKDIEWQLIYVGNPQSEDLDLVLESVVVGPVQKGRHKFVFDADAPDPSKIAAENVADISLLLLKCFYDNKLFAKIGWFVTNEYTDEELQNNKPVVPKVDKLRREIQTSDVRVNLYACCWREEFPPEDTNADNEEIAFNTAEKVEEEEEEEAGAEDDDDDDEESDEDKDKEIDLDQSAKENDAGITEEDAAANKKVDAAGDGDVEMEEAV